MNSVETVLLMLASSHLTDKDLDSFCHWLDRVGRRHLRDAVRQIREAAEATSHVPERNWVDAPSHLRNTLAHSQSSTRRENAHLLRQLLQEGTGLSTREAV